MTSLIAVSNLSGGWKVSCSVSLILGLLFNIVDWLTNCSFKLNINGNPINIMEPLIMPVNYERIFNDNFVLKLQILTNGSVQFLSITDLRSYNINNL